MSSWLDALFITRVRFCRRLKEKDIVAFRVEGTGFASKTDEKQLRVTSSKAVARF